jgi:hypothetical protein
MSKEPKISGEKTKAGKVLKSVKDAVIGAQKETKKDTVSSDAVTDSKEFVVTITINSGGKVKDFTYRGKTEQEVMDKVRRAKRSIQWLGSVVMRILVRNEKINQKLIEKIENILKATE